MESSSNQYTKTFICSVLFRLLLKIAIPVLPVASASNSILGTLVTGADPCRGPLCLDWVNFRSLKQNWPKVVDLAYTCHVYFLAFTTWQRLLVGYLVSILLFFLVMETLGFSWEYGCLEKRLYFLIFLAARYGHVTKFYLMRWMTCKHKVIGHGGCF